MSTDSDARNTTAPNTRRIGWAKLSAVYCVAGLASGKPQSQAGPRRQRRAQQDGLEGQPLGDEAVERRQRRNRRAAGEEGKSGERHIVDQAAQMLHVPLPGGVEHGAGSEEQQAFEEAMVEDVKQ